MLSNEDELGVTLKGMDDFEEAKQMMSHEEVTSRFKKVFGRDMTPAERSIFFVTRELAHDEEKD